TDVPPPGAPAAGETASVAVIQLQPDAAARLVDPHRIGGEAEVGAAGQVQVLGIGAVEQVVHAGTGTQAVVDAVGGVEREGGKPGTGTEITRDHVALVQCHPVLPPYHPQQCAGGPARMLPAGTETPLQR